MELSNRDSRLFGFDGSEAWIENLRSASRGGRLGSIGSFELIEEVGRGGQGVVFRARQPGTGRHIALKRLLAGSFASPQQRRRFEREVEAAATLNHPGVVTVYGTEIVNGLPVLAMEWIDGVPITEWARALSKTDGTRRRILDLFVALCEAVEHAHQRGVLHRDLKPSNVLVDALGRPRVLDFGMAKFLDEERAAELSRSSEVMGTPAYAAPEQLSGPAAQVDSRSDVYSLGAILFELLTGRKLIEGSGLEALSHVLEHREAPRPSSLDGSIGAELDAIVLQALAHERERRYQSVDALASDVRRYLAGEPVLAHPPGAWYLARKLVTKHRGAAAFLGLLCAVSVGYVWLSLRHARVLALERDRATDHAKAADSARAAAQSSERAAREAEAKAQEEADNARTTLEFLVHDVLGATDQTKVGHEPTVPEVLAAAIEKVGQRFAASPLREQAVRRVIADSLSKLGRFREAARAYRPYLEACRQDPEDLLRLGNAECYFGYLLASSGEFREAEDLLTASLEHLEACDAPGPLADAHMNMGLLLANTERLEDAAGHYEQSLDLVQLVGPSEENTRASAVSGLIECYNALGDFAKALEMGEEELVVERRTHGTGSVRSAHLLSALSISHLFLGDCKKAVVTGRESLEIFIEQFGEENPRTLLARTRLGIALKECEEHAGAEEMLRRALATEIRVDFPCHSGLILHVLGEVLGAMGRYEDAEPILREAVQVLAACGTLGQLTASEQLGRVLAHVGKWDEAAELLETSLERHRRIVGDPHPDVGVGRYYQAELAIEMGDRERAVECFADAVRILEEALAEGQLDAAPHLSKILGHYARFERDGGDPARAETLEQRAAQMLALVRSRQDQDEVSK